MIIRSRKTRFNISINKLDFSILQIAANIGPCTFSEVHEKLNDGRDILIVMRRMHVLVDLGLLARVGVSKQGLYKVKSNYRALVKSYVKVTD